MLLTASIAVVAVALRYLTLDADPPSYYRFGIAWGDEGPWAWPAAHWVVNGHWPEGGRPFVSVAPTYSYVLALVFRLVGPGLGPARFLSLVSGVCSMAVLWAICRRSLGRTGAAFISAAYASSFYLVIFERHASPEALALLLGVVGIALTTARDPRTWGGLAFLMSVLAFTSKGTLIFLPVVTVAALALGARDRRQWGPVAPLRLYLSAVLGLLGVGIFCIQIPNVLGYVAGAERPEVTGQALAGMAALAWRWAIAPLNADYFLSQPLPFVGCVLALSRGIPDKVPARRLATVLALWVLAWWVVVPVYDLKGSRYYLLTPPFLVLGAMGWLGLSTRCRHVLDSFRESGGRRLIPSALLPVGRLLLGGAAAFWLACLVAVAWSQHGGMRARWSLLPLACVALATSGVVARTITRAGGVLRRSRAWSAVLMVGVLSTQISWWGWWYVNRTHIVVEALAEVARRPPLQGIVCGDEAPLILLGNPGAGDALYPSIWPECAQNGETARFVAVAEDRRCSPYEMPWITQRREALLRREPILTVELPADDWPRGRCHHVVVPWNEPGAP